MRQIRRTALAAIALSVLAGTVPAAAAKQAEPVKTTSTTDRLKAKKKAPAASLDKKAAAAPQAAKPAAPRLPARSGS